jgi:hypothetical protein
LAAFSLSWATYFDWVGSQELDIFIVHSFLQVRRFVDKRSLDKCHPFRKEFGKEYLKKWLITILGLPEEV